MAAHDFNIRSLISIVPDRIHDSAFLSPKLSERQRNYETIKSALKAPFADIENQIKSHENIEDLVSLVRVIDKFIEKTSYTNEPDYITTARKVLHVALEKIQTTSKDIEESEFEMIEDPNQQYNQYKSELLLLESKENEMDKAINSSKDELDGTKTFSDFDERYVNALKLRNELNDDISSLNSKQNKNKQDISLKKKKEELLKKCHQFIFDVKINNYSVEFNNHKVSGKFTRGVFYQKLITRLDETNKNVKLDESKKQILVNKCELVLLGFKKEAFEDIKKDENTWRRFNNTNQLINEIKEMKENSNNREIRNALLKECREFRKFTQDILYPPS